MILPDLERTRAGAERTEPGLERLEKRGRRFEADCQLAAIDAVGELVHSVAIEPTVHERFAKTDGAVSQDPFVSPWLEHPQIPRLGTIDRDPYSRKRVAQQALGGHGSLPSLVKLSFAEANGRRAGRLRLQSVQRREHPRPPEPRYRCATPSSLLPPRSHPVADKRSADQRARIAVGSARSRAPGLPLRVALRRAVPPARRRRSASTPRPAPFGPSG